MKTSPTRPSNYERLSGRSKTRVIREAGRHLELQRQVASQGASAFTNQSESGRGETEEPEMVTVNGEPAKVVMRSLGRVTVRFKDGRKKSVDAEEVGPAPGTRQARAGRLVRLLTLRGGRK